MNKQESELVIVGKSFLEVSPDKCDISFSVSYNGKDAEKLIQKVAEQFNKTKLDLSEIVSTDNGKLATTSYNIQDHYTDIETDKKDRYDNPILQRKKDGYIVYQSATLKLYNISLAGKSIDCIIKSGITAIDSVIFGTSKLIEYSNKARELSIKDAVEKANAYIKCLSESLKRDIKLGRILKLCDNHIEPVYTRSNSFALAACAKNESSNNTEITGSNLSFQDSVKVIWSILQK